MKDFIKKLMSDNDNDKNFTKYEIVVYGILMPIGFMLIMGIAGWLETRSDAIAAQ